MRGEERGDSEQRSEASREARVRTEARTSREASRQRGEARRELRVSTQDAPRFDCEEIDECEQRVSVRRVGGDVSKQAREGRVGRDDDVYSLRNSE